MLTGELVSLRPVERDDIPTLHVIDAAYETWPETNYSPYAPKSLDEVLKAFDGDEESAYRGSDSFVPFTVLVGEDIAGMTCFWGIDLHNRRAHLGIGLGEQFRGQGYGTDATRVMLHYAFVDRGFHRVQLEVLAGNTGAIRSYGKAGFVVDGTMRESAWVRGEFVDEIYMSVLRPDWVAATSP